MKTIFINRLPFTNDHRAVYEWICSHGHTPEDVMLICKPGAKGSNHALARFEYDGDAMLAQECLNGQVYKDRKLQVFLSTSELYPPTDARWNGLWLNWQPNKVQNTASRGDYYGVVAPRIKTVYAD